MIRRNTLAFFIVVAVTTFAGRFVAAQPLADRVPVDAMVYVGWAGSDSLGPGYAGSHLKAVLDAGDVPRFVNAAIPKLLDRLAKQQPKARDLVPALNDIARPMWRHPT